MTGFLFHNFSLPYTTQNAGTAIVAVLPGLRDWKLKVVSFRYTSGATSHNVSFMMPIGYTTLVSDAAKSATSMVLTADPGAWGSAKSVAANNIASGDYIAYLQNDMTWAYNKLTGTPTTDSATGNVTIAVSSLGAKVLKGSTIYFFGVYTDSNPWTGLAHYATKSPVSTTYTWGSDSNATPVVPGRRCGDPMLFYSDNATNQGYLEYADCGYGQN